MGWDFYCKGYGPTKIGDFRAEVRAMILAEILAESTTTSAMYFAIRKPATAHDATIWNVAEGEPFVTVLTMPYKRPTGRNGFGKGNAWDETAGPNENEPARKVFDLLTPLRPMNAAELAYMDEYESTHRMPYPIPEGVKCSLVWAYKWRASVQKGFAAAALCKEISPGVKFRTAGKLRFKGFDADTFTAVKGYGKAALHYVPENRPDTRVRLGKTNLVGAMVLTE